MGIRRVWVCRPACLTNRLVVDGCERARFPRVHDPRGAFSPYTHILCLPCISKQHRHRPFTGRWADSWWPQPLSASTGVMLSSAESQPLFLNTWGTALPHSNILPPDVFQICHFVQLNYCDIKTPEMATALTEPQAAVSPAREASATPSTTPAAIAPAPLEVDDASEVCVP